MLPPEKSAIQKRVVWITGASSGIGKALALRFAELGYDLVLMGRRLDRLQDLAEQIHSQGQQALAIRCDVTQDSDLHRAIRETIQRLGRLDIVVANSGFAVNGEVETLSLEDYRRQFETNVFGVLRTVQAAIPELKKTHGCLALIGSVTGYLSMPGSSAYSMSKHSIRALSQSLRAELSPSGISVTHIAPGFVQTEIHQVGNDGRWDPSYSKAKLEFLHMPVEKAARQIAQAILSRKPELVVTYHGKIAVFVQRHFPWVFHFLLNFRKPRKKSSPKLQTFPEVRS